MPSPVGARSARLAPLSRSVAVRVSFGPTWLWWGATWAYACGVVAALPAEPSLPSAVLAGAGWLVAVPLFGAFWSPLLASESSEPRPQETFDTTETRSSRLAKGGTRLGTLGAAAMLGATLILGATVGPSIALALALGSAVLGAAWLIFGREPEPTGVVRSVLEVFTPAIVGWLALSGPVSAPAAMVASEGTIWAAGRWLATNGDVVAVFAAFALVHHGATTALRRRDLTQRWWEITTGYVVAALVLAGGGHAAAAMAVALLFVVAWPFHADLRAGRVLWHLRYAQWFSMAAMMVASAAL